MDEHVEVKRQKKPPTTCQWKPNSNNEKLRLYVCVNPFFVDPATNKKYTTCAMHISQVLIKAN